MQAAARQNAEERAATILPVYAVTPFTMLDFPGKTACIVWFSGCNMRCGYCHNPQIVKGKGRFGSGRVLDFLESRRSLLEGVVLSGGEATLYPGLVDFARHVKEMGFAIKLDTNGTRPDVLARMLEDKNLDYVALDYKAPREKFSNLTHCQAWDAFEQSLSILTAQNQVPYEIRTTVHTSLLKEADINAIIADLDQRGYSGTYYIQNFIGDEKRPTLDNLSPQSTTLDKGKIAEPKGFTVDFRNF